MAMAWDLESVATSSKAKQIRRAELWSAVAEFSASARWAGGRQDGVGPCGSDGVLAVLA